MNSVFLNKNRIEEPNFLIEKKKNFYRDYLDCKPNEFFEVTQKIQRELLLNADFETKNSCSRFYSVAQECKQEVGYFSSFYCNPEFKIYYDCLTINSLKYERYLKYYLNKNKEGYLDHWKNI
ncbi:hypothetical protein DLAC_11445 [Tieghemostelium lacteum]|uniref:Uncharacterized protein n=1 Tax=Tieghemostelium lacteum TaxID=361077 RepID=A0A152AA31_TIELA|nr:hypothetical protein DLAC_11445 [Tieghemostelium lacteum]|eukprot:KYR03079.1 hypothetical protein DLAC_11445 [Tieghemostelium lacteum]